MVFALNYKLVMECGNDKPNTLIIRGLCVCVCVCVCGWGCGCGCGTALRLLVWCG